MPSAARRFPYSTPITRALPSVLAVTLWAFIYIPNAGHGFIKDDFVWITKSRLDDGDWAKLTRASTGFFRPVTSATFALNYALAGLDSLWYGQTNVLLAAACMAALFSLLRGVGIGVWAACFGALLWGFNFHGLSLAILWISGRTSLLSTLAGALAASAWVRGRRFIALVCAIAGMLAKEEAFATPALLMAWSAISARGSVWARVRSATRQSWHLWVAAAVCLALRFLSGAYTPTSAPDFYRYQFDLGVLLTNSLHYLDRSGTAAALGLLALWLLAGRPHFTLEKDNARVLAWGCAWWVFALLPTVLLPIRSSLYVLLPGAGVMLVASAIADGLIRHIAAAVQRRVAVGLLILLVTLSPIYHLRNRRLVREAELSATVVAELQRLPDVRGVVVLYDDQAGRPFAEHAFGGLAREAAELVSRGRLDLWISPRPMDLGPDIPEPDPTRIVAELSLSNGEIRRVR